MAAERAMLEATALGSPPAVGDVRLAPAAPSADPVPLPSWWAEDPVAPAEPEGSTAAPPTSKVFSDDVAYDGPSDSAPQLSHDSPAAAAADPLSDLAGTPLWKQPTDYEQEAHPPELERPWSYAPVGYDEGSQIAPALDSSQPLASAVAEPLTPLPESPRTHGEQTYGGQTFDERADIRDASDAVSRSASVIEEQLQSWLTDDYDAAGSPSSSAADRFDTLDIHASPAASTSEADNPFARDRRDQQTFDSRTFDEPVAATEDLEQENAAGEEGYAVSAFSTDGLSIETLQPEVAPHYGTAETVEDAPYADSHHRSASIEESPAAASPRETSEPAAGDGGDESVEEYMRRLLARMRGVSENEVTLPGIDREESPKPEARPRASRSEPLASMSMAAHDTEPVSETWTEPFDPTKFVPRLAAPEKNRDIDALRELANTSARSAIHVSARRKHGTAIMIKSGVALVGLTAGAALISINGLRVNIGLIATLASFMVAIIWGYDALATLRPLLQASRAAKSQMAKPSAQEPAEETSQS
jgi:hypothetical protein